MSSVYAVQEVGKSKSMMPVVYNDEGVPATIRSLVETIVQLVHAEFGRKAEVFVPIVVRMDALGCPEFEATKSPGVYVFIHEDEGGQESFKCVKESFAALRR